MFCNIIHTYSTVQSFVANFQGSWFDSVYQMSNAYIADPDHKTVDGIGLHPSMHAVVFSHLLSIQTDCHRTKVLIDAKVVVVG